MAANGADGSHENTQRVRKVELRSAPTKIGENVLVQIILQARGDENAVGFSFQFDPGALAFKGARLGAPTREATLFVNDQHDGRVGIALALPINTSFPRGEHRVVELEFEVLETASPGETPITFDDYPVLREVASVTAEVLETRYADVTIPIRARRGLSVVRVEPGGPVRIQLKGKQGVTYAIEASDDLIQWTVVHEVTVDGSATEWIDAVANRERRFYRVRP